ncbi:uncharacterized protein JCM15063_002045 [Sporobolomyces koalae]|uniref:uncharacterized protein n=1 Tax=Sporobolomyces koalae TaxID=500713 RepID=UPI00317584B1
MPVWNEPIDDDANENEDDAGGIAHTPENANTDEAHQPMEGKSSPRNLLMANVPDELALIRCPDFKAARELDFYGASGSGSQTLERGTSSRNLSPERPGLDRADMERQDYRDLPADQFAPRRPRSPRPRLRSCSPNLPNNYGPGEATVDAMRILAAAVRRSARETYSSGERRDLAAHVASAGDHDGIDNRIYRGDVERRSASPPRERQRQRSPEHVQHRVPAHPHSDFGSEPVAASFPQTEGVPVGGEDELDACPKCSLGFRGMSSIDSEAHMRMCLDEGGGIYMERCPVCDRSLSDPGWDRQRAEKHVDDCCKALTGGGTAVSGERKSRREHVIFECDDRSVPKDNHTGQALEVRHALSVYVPAT